MYPGFTKPPGHLIGTLFASFSFGTMEVTMKYKSPVGDKNALLTVALYQQLLEQAKELAQKAKTRLLMLQRSIPDHKRIEKRDEGRGS